MPGRVRAVFTISDKGVIPTWEITYDLTFLALSTTIMGLAGSALALHHGLFQEPGAAAWVRRISSMCFGARAPWLRVGASVWKATNKPKMLKLHGWWSKLWSPFGVP